MPNFIIWGPLGSPRLQADSLRHNASTDVTGTAVYLAPIFPKWSRKHYPLAMAAGDLPWPLQALWRLIWRSTLYLKEFEGSHRCLELCWALVMRVCIPSEWCTPHCWAETAGLFPKQLPHPWKQLALEPSHLHLMWPNAHGHGGLFCSFVWLVWGQFSVTHLRWVQVKPFTLRKKVKW